MSKVFKYVVGLPRDIKMKDIRRWLLDNVGPSEEDWAINVDMEVVEFFSNKISQHPRDSSRLSEIFNIGFTSEEDKVKFILTFL